MRAGRRPGARLLAEAHSLSALDLNYFRVVNDDLDRPERDLLEGAQDCGDDRTLLWVLHVIRAAWLSGLAEWLGLHGESA